MPRGVKRTMSYAEEVLLRTDRSTGCWLWTGYLLPGRGYGQIGQNFLVHRVAWEHLVGPIPDGLVLDHECHNRDETCNAAGECRHRRCVNPDHLAVKTSGDNSLAGRTPSALNAAKTHCIRGHEFTPANTYYRPDRFGRICITCRDAALARVRQQPDYLARHAAGERRRRAERKAA